MLSLYHCKWGKSNVHYQISFQMRESNHLRCFWLWCVLPECSRKWKWLGWCYHWIWQTTWLIPPGWGWTWCQGAWESREWHRVTKPPKRPPPSAGPWRSLCVRGSQLCSYSCSGSFVSGNAAKEYFSLQSWVISQLSSELWCGKWGHGLECFFRLNEAFQSNCFLMRFNCFLSSLISVFETETEPQSKMLLGVTKFT